ncbi:MAG: GNAT family N-acetyltransferase, partial [Bacteroidia bacterium]|nr:GNAT family N-acetyltransferase [Bacteroidia bacterium]
MKIITKTDRLYLREFIEDDAVHFFEMNNDPKILQYTGDIPFENFSQATDFIKNYEEYQNHKMGRWAVCLKKTDKFIGWCGLKFHPEKKIVEIGFRFYKEYWNKGYATESAKASLEYGFKKLYLPEIYAHAHINNSTSHKVINKCGLKFIKEFDYEGIPANLYKIDNPYLDIKTIPSTATYPVRHPVLREGRPIEDCRFDHDDDPNTFHLGLYIDSDLLAVVTYLRNKCPEFKEDQFQLRGMAVLKYCQKRGFGNLLIHKGEQLLKQKGTKLVWCNVREVAVNFYKKNGFKIIGKPFVLPKIGLHYLMYKSI